MTRLEPQETLCTVVFRLSKGESDAGRFIYALACSVESMEDVEVVTLSVGDLHYSHQKESRNDPQ